MAADRFIHLQTVPHRNAVAMLLEDFFGRLEIDGVAVVSLGAVVWKTNRFFITLPGKTRHPLRRLEPDWTLVRAMEEQPDTRWIEVVLSDDNIDVITRPMADHFTRAIADGVAKLIAEYWKGTLEEG